MEPYQVRNILNDLLQFVPHQRKQPIDVIVFEVKNLKNEFNLAPALLLSSSVQVLLDRCQLHQRAYEEWSENIARVFKPFNSLWQYARRITDDDDRGECVFQLFEYCQNPKRPHLQKGFGYIVSSLLAGDIICSVSTAQFVDAMMQSDDEVERVSGTALIPFLSRSCPW